MKNDATLFWNAKAVNYPSPDDPESEGTARRILDAAVRLEADFSGASIIEIGAGTGIMTLPLARTARHVTALDLSEGMLAKLRSAAQKAALTNITVVCAPWETTDPAHGYDYAVSTFCPAIRTEADLLRLSTLASKGVLLAVWGDTRSNPLWEAVYEAHGACYGPIVARAGLLEALSRLPYDIRIVPIATGWEKRLTPDEALAEARLSLHARGIVPDETAIRHIIDARIEPDGTIRHTTVAEDKVIYWKTTRS